MTICYEVKSLSIIMLIRKPSLNADLESIRTVVLSNPENLVELCESLSTRTKSIHASYLFLNYYGMQARKAICLSLSSTQSQMISNWKELGATLGLSYQQIMVIDNYYY